MKKLLVIGLVCVLAGSANAAVLGLQTPDGSLHGEADPLNLVISESAEIQVTLDLYTLDYGTLYYEYCYGANLYMDSVEMAPVPEPINPPHDPLPWNGTENMEILDVTRAGDTDFVWGVRAFDVQPMDEIEFEASPAPSPVHWDNYYLVANLSPDQGYSPLSSPDEDGYTRHVLDTIVVHCTGASTDTIWFENYDTFQSPTSSIVREPSVFSTSPTASLTIDELTGAGAFGTLGFRNAFMYDAQAHGGPPPYVDWAREGFWIVQTPEPASFALLALGGLALLRRKK